jgi:hypothetical protein
MDNLFKEFAVYNIIIAKKMYYVFFKLRAHSEEITPIHSEKVNFT